MLQQQRSSEEALFYYCHSFMSFPCRSSRQGRGGASDDSGSVSAFGARCFFQDRSVLLLPRLVTVAPPSIPAAALLGSAVDPAALKQYYPCTPICVGIPTCMQHSQVALRLRLSPHYHPSCSMSLLLCTHMFGYMELADFEWGSGSWASIHTFTMAQRGKACSCRVIHMAQCARTRW